MGEAFYKVLWVVWSCIFGVAILAFLAIGFVAFLPVILPMTGIVLVVLLFSLSAGLFVFIQKRAFPKDKKKRKKYPY